MALCFHFHWVLESIKLVFLLSQILSSGGKANVKNEKSERKRLHSRYFFKKHDKMNWVLQLKKYKDFWYKQQETLSWYRSGKASTGWRCEALVGVNQGKRREGCSLLMEEQAGMWRGWGVFLSSSKEKQKDEMERWAELGHVYHCQSFKKNLWSL